MGGRGGLWVTTGLGFRAWQERQPESGAPVRSDREPSSVSSQSGANLDDRRYRGGSWSCSLFFLNMNLLYVRYVNDILESNHEVLRLSSMPLSRAQRLRLEAAHEDCRDDLVLVGLSLSVQISKLQGAADAEVGQSFGAVTFLGIISFNVRSVRFLSCVPRKSPGWSKWGMTGG